MNEMAENKKQRESAERLTSYGKALISNLTEQEERIARELAPMEPERVAAIIVRSANIRAEKP